jgi:alkylhydroperoxidase/carboxymuconolactone decarboxylase family protein YurZ
MGENAPIEIIALLNLRGGKMDLVHHTKEVYTDFFQSAHREGALDAKTKELIHIALVLAMRCEP